MAVAYVSAMRRTSNGAAFWALRGSSSSSSSSSRGFLTVCGGTIQHKTEENQDQLDSANTLKCAAENAMQQKMSPSPCAGQKKLQLKMNELVKEHQTLQEKYRRIVAHVEDDNRRIRKCVEDARLYGIHSLCKDILAVADLLEKTTRSVTEEDLANSSPTLKNFYKGVCLIDEKLCKIFSKHGLEKMNSIGLEYNSAEHEILLRVPSVDALPSTVVKIVQEGYKLHGRVLRTAQVGLAIEAQPHFKAQ
ncbi:grpE protein homolog 2, mitochondrial-like isoform X2 [Rhincodon typus]|uniref:grpE protein homolog 2, mitochondrial-like isoform X2 n=1 Tax=Rhincodon typus TaxID=259920 RepID=UPI00202FF29A|nr:grpE protein homolog 2, mitochondrial-like isoform X2 [Rhincodon typus]